MGLKCQGVITLNTGFILFKFVQRSDVPITKVIQSPWWFQATSVRKMLNDARYGQGGDFSVTNQVRQNAALSKTWGRAGSNYIISSKVINPLSAFWGTPRCIGLVTNKDKTAQGLATNQTISQVEIIPNPDCIQFFIPGFHEQRVIEKSISVISRTKLSSSGDLADGDIETFLRNISSK